MTIAVSRRRFLQISSATALAGAATQLEPISRAAQAAGATAGEVKTVPTFCEMCFWRCGGIAYVRDGRLWKFEGNPIDPQSRGRLCPRGTGAVGTVTLDADTPAGAQVRHHASAQHRKNQAAAPKV